MKRLWRNLPGYLQQANLAAQIPFVYRFNWASHFVGVVLQVYLLKVVWTAVYAGRSNVEGVGLDELVAYLTLVNLQMNLLWPFIGGALQERVREGKIALDLTRPISLLGQMIAQQAGLTAGTLPFVVLTFPLAIVLGGAAPPASPAAALLYLVSLTLAYAIVVLLGLLLGLIAFWTLETQGFFVIYFFLNQFFAGALVPLWFFPLWLRALAEVLPFQAQAFVPVSIYLGRLSGDEIGRALAVQLFWVVALAALTQWVWRRAMRRVIIQGG